MGKMIKFGICHDFKIRKKDLENERISVRDVLASSNLDIGLYNQVETPTHYKWLIKETILLDELEGFLTEEYETMQVEKEEKASILKEVADTSTANDIIELADNSYYMHLAKLSSYSYLYNHSRRISIPVEYDCLTFYAEGSISMECYNDFLRYLENLIRRRNSYQLSKAVKVTIG